MSFSAHALGHAAKLRCVIACVGLHVCEDLLRYATCPHHFLPRSCQPRCFVCVLTLHGLRPQFIVLVLTAIFLLMPRERLPLCFGILLLLSVAPPLFIVFVVSTRQPCGHPSQMFESPEGPQATLSLEQPAAGFLHGCVCQTRFLLCAGGLLRSRHLALTLLSYVLLLVTFQVHCCADPMNGIIVVSFLCPYNGAVPAAHTLLDSHSAAGFPDSAASTA